MKTIAIINAKGGCGKTTITLNLAVAATLAKRNAAVIDLDPQASSANRAENRKADLPVVLSAHASRLQHEMKRVADNGGDLLFLDTAPHSDSIALEAAKVADLILIPTATTILDIETIPKTLDLIRISKTGSPVFVVLNKVAALGREADEAAEAIAAFGAQICPVRIGQRVAYARSLITGEGAQEFEPEGKAAQEIEQLHKFISAQLQSFTTEGETDHVQQVRQRA